MPDHEETIEPPSKSGLVSVAGQAEKTQAQGEGTDLRTFLIADVRGYTTYTREHGDEAAAALASTFAVLVRDVVEPRQGSLLELRGDEALVVFVSARQALRAAVDLQARFAQEALPRGVGIGLDAGEAVPVGDGYRGGALNLAARLCAQAGPGQILASEAVIHLAARVEGISYVDPRTFRLKGYAEPVRAFEVVPEGRARRGSLQTFRVRTGRAAQRPAFWAAAGAALLVVVVLAVAVPKALGRRSPPASNPTSPAPVLAANALVRVDPGFNRVVASIPVGKGPSAVTTGAGSVWVTNSSDGSVSRIDPVTNKVTAVIRVGREPDTIGFDGNDVWVANRLGNSLSEIDPASNRVVATVALQTSPVGLAFEGGAVFVGGSVPCCPVVAAVSAPIVRVDPASLQAVEVAQMNETACAKIAAGEGSVWVVSDFGQLSKLDPATGRKVGRVELRARSGDVLVGTEGVWVATFGFPGAAMLVDPAALRVTATVPVGTSQTEFTTCYRGYPSMAEAQSFLWVANPVDGTMTEIDEDARRGIATVNVGKSPTGIAVGFGSVWVTVKGS